MFINVAYPLDHEHVGGQDGDPFYEYHVGGKLENDPRRSSAFGSGRTSATPTRKRVLGRHIYRHGAHLHGIPDAYFGVVISSHSLEHFIDPLQVGKHAER